MVISLSKQVVNMADNSLNEVNFSTQSSDLINAVGINRGLQKSDQNAPSDEPAKLGIISMERLTETKSLTLQNESRRVISKLVDQTLYIRSKMALADVRILRAEMQPDLRTSACGSCSTTQAL